MKNIHDEKQEIIFITEEITIDLIKSQEDISEYTTRQYKWVNGEIKLIHETPVLFKGYTNIKQYLCKRGDIIDYFTPNGEIFTAIVGYVPPIYDKTKENMYDFYDDSYLVYLLGEGDTHEHVHATNIICLSLIDIETYKKFKEKLKEHYETYNDKRNKR